MPRPRSPSPRRNLIPAHKARAAARGRTAVRATTSTAVPISAPLNAQPRAAARSAARAADDPAQRPTARTAADRLPAAARPGRAGARSRATILAAARSEFAAHGLEGARVSAIAARAGVNKQLLYYYFGDKSHLYQAIVDEVYLGLRQREQGLNLDALPPREAMIRLVSLWYDYLAAHPEVIGLINHENAQGAPFVRQSDSIQASMAPLIALVTEVLTRGEQAGEFRGGIDPVWFYISVAGMGYFYFSNRLTLGPVFARDLDRRRSVRGYRDHVITFTLSALRP